MRLIAVMPDQRQAGFLVDSLRNGGFDRKDLIVSSLAEDESWHRPEEANEEVAFIKTEREGLWETGTFANGIKGLKSTEGVIVAVEAPKHESDRIRVMMEQSGAVEIIQD